MNDNMIIDGERRHAAEYCVVNNCVQEVMLISILVCLESKKYPIDLQKKSQNLIGQILDLRKEKKTRITNFRGTGHFEVIWFCKVGHIEFALCINCRIYAKSEKNFKVDTRFLFEDHIN